MGASEYLASASFCHSRAWAPAPLWLCRLLSRSPGSSHSAGGWGRRDEGSTQEGLCTRPASDDITSSHILLAGTQSCGHSLQQSRLGNGVSLCAQSYWGHLLALRDGGQQDPFLVSPGPCLWLFLLAEQPAKALGAPGPSQHNHLSTGHPQEGVSPDTWGENGVPQPWHCSVLG